MDSIIVATTKTWNIENFFKLKANYSKNFNFHLITNKDELNWAYVSALAPKYLFFPHWSWMIPKKIYRNYECIVFHMTDLPYGRGGSPLQNLIIEQVYDTKISALRVDEGIDSGDIYFKEAFNVSLGSAEEIFIALSDIVFNKMIPRFLEETLIPVKQKGDVKTFKRRKPEESNLLLLNDKTMVKIYDFIRMLDAEGYPKAFLDFGDFKIEFSEVHRKSDKLIGKFEVVKK